MNFSVKNNNFSPHLMCLKSAFKGYPEIAFQAKKQGIKTKMITINGNFAVFDAAKKLSKLIKEEGRDRTSLIQKAYVTREHYEAYLRRLTDAEQEVDHSVADFQRQSQEIRERLQAEQAQVAALRRREIDQIYPKER